MLKIIEDEFPQLGSKNSSKVKENAGTSQLNEGGKKRKKKKAEAVDITSLMFKVSEDDDWN